LGVNAPGIEQSRSLCHRLLTVGLWHTRSNATTLHESVDESSHDSDHILGDVFREFGRVPLYRDLPPRLRGPSQFENLPDELALVSIFGRLDSATLCRCACVCSQLRRWSDTNRLWMRLCQQRWGVDIIKRVGKNVSNGSWKLYFSERSLAHRAEVASTPLSLERLRLVDEDDERKHKIKVDKNRPMRSQLEAACVYMPKSNQDVRTMEMARIAAAPTEPEPQPPQNQHGKSATGGKKTRRGRRGRGAKVEAAANGSGSGGRDTSGLTVRQSSAADVAANDARAAQDARAARMGDLTSPAGLAAGIFGSTGGSGLFGANVRRMAPSPPLEPNRRPPSPRGGIGGRRTPSDGGSDSNSPWSTRGHELKPATPPAHLQGRSKQPTPPPSTSSGRRRDLTLRAFGSHEAPPPAPRSGMPPRSFDDMPMSQYGGGFVTPTRRHNVEDDVSSSDDDDDDDDLYSNLCHPVFDAAEGSGPTSTSSAPDGASGREGMQHVSSELATRVLQPSVRGSPTEIQPPSADEVGSAASPPCPWHGAEPLDMYCIQCKMLVCNRCCLFGHHSGHPRIPASEAYDQVRQDLSGKAAERLQRLEAKCNACEDRMQGEKERVAKSRSAMKKSLRSSVKSLRDMLNQKQNELMEVIRVEEEAKLAHVQEMTGSLSHVRKELLDASRSLNVVAQVKKDCPYVIESANALDSSAAGVEATLREIDEHITMLPQVAAFKFHLNDQVLKEGIQNLTLQPGEQG
jgi:hypothetical protein